jgi:hypothetical protein
MFLFILNKKYTKWVKNILNKKYIRLFIIFELTKRLFP